MAAGLTDGLVGHWPLDGNFNDVSPAGNHGTGEGVLFVAGKHGQAASFDGVASYVRIPWSPSLQVGSGDFSFSVWLKPQSGVDNVRVAENRGTGASAKGWQIKIGGGSGWRIDRSLIDDGSGALKRCDGCGGTYAAGVWRQLTMVYAAGDQLRFYIDGRLDGVVPVGPYGSLDNSLPLVLGAALAHDGVEGTASQFFAGQLDEARLYNRALDEMEIAELAGAYPGWTVAEDNVHYLNGNVGVGTAAPETELHVVGEVRATEGVAIGDHAFRRHNTANLNLYSGEADKTALVLYGDGGPRYGALYGQGGGANFGLLDGDGQWSYRAYKDNYTAFLIDNSEKVRITADGAVGIGTSNPQAGLDVAGAVRIGSQAFCGPSAEGAMRYNADLKAMEYCDGSSWRAMESAQAPVSNGSLRLGVNALAERGLINPTAASYIHPFLDDSQFGADASLVGDVDGDGVDDAAVSAPLWDNGRGAVTLFFMLGNGEIKSDSTIFADSQAGLSYLSGAVCGPGDLNDDGVPDLIVGRPENHSRSSPVVLYLDGDGGVAESQGLSLTFDDYNGTRSYGFGRALAPMGDFDGNGAPDFLVGKGILGNRTNDAGLVLLKQESGQVSLKAPVASIRNQLAAAGVNVENYIGSAVTALGDVNGDGVPEIAVGAEYFQGGSGVDKGGVYVVFLDVSGSATDATPIGEGHAGFAGLIAEGDRFGASLAGLGDLDGDGVPDLAVGAPGDDHGEMDAGAIWLLFLHADGTVKNQKKLTRDAERLIHQPGEGFQFGTSLASMGDIDQDGLPELMVGAPFAEFKNPEGVSGTVYMLHFNVLFQQP